MCSTLSHMLASTLHTRLFAQSSVTFALHVLSQDGSLLAALVNAATLAAVDAGVPMTDYAVACTAGSTASHTAADDDGTAADPLLDLNLQEEPELPGLPVATLGASDRVAVLVCETRVHADRLEGMLAVAVDGCKQVRAILDAVVREAGARLTMDPTVARDPPEVDMDMDDGDDDDM